MTISSHPVSSSLSSSWANAEIKFPSEELSSSFAEAETGAIQEKATNDDVNEAMENIRNFFNLFDGSTFNEEHFDEAYFRAFDKSISGTTHPIPSDLNNLQGCDNTIEMDSATVCKSAKMYAMLENVSIVESIKHLQDTTIEYSVKAEYKGHWVTFTSKADTCGSKIIRFQRFVSKVTEMEKQ